MTSKYSRQINCPRIGEDGQRQLRVSSVALVGCGALGTSIAESLVRQGIGRLWIFDPDTVEDVNLHRQALFTQHDIGASKALSARCHLNSLNSDVSICAQDTLATPEFLAVATPDLIIDGTDNFDARYMINDVSIDRKIPWVYGGVMGTQGMVLPVLPGKTACFRCLWPDAASAPNPDWKAVGILPSVVHIVAAMQVIESIKILTSQLTETALIKIDAWSGQMDRLMVAKSPQCRCW